MTNAAFKACYAEWKVIKTRAAVQLVFEIPIEQADQAYQALGGMPIAAREIWCGIARLKPGSEVMPVAAAEETTAPVPRQKLETQPRPVSRSSAGADKCVAVHMGGVHCIGKCIEPRNCLGSPLPANKERRAFSDMQPSQQAGMLSQDPAFQKFLAEKYFDQWMMIGSEDARLPMPVRAGALIRHLCKVDSRADIKPDNADWSALVLAYRLWQREPEFV